MITAGVGWTCRRVKAVRSVAFTTASLRGKDLVDAGLASWARDILPRARATLLQNGYVVMNNAVDPALARALKAEIESLRSELYANSTHVYVSGKKDPLLLEKDHIQEMELLTVPPSHEHLKQWFDNSTIRKNLNAAIPTLHASHHMIKIQFNEGDGGCFPMHFDSYGDDGKCVTAILYLNEDWVHGHGGELELYPFPYAPVTIAPVFNRLVLFSSTQMLHRVLPATHPRYCLTTWLYKSPQTARATAPSRPADDAFDRMVQQLAVSPFRRHMAKLYYANEWKQSLVASHKPTHAFQAYLDSYHQDIAIIEAATLKMLSTFGKAKDADTTTFPTTTKAFLDRLQRNYQHQSPRNLLFIPWWQ
ncbi:hypothetical protein H310_01865 [Aphanomyces invadans]|uniref:Fe2OG dioxygenase domain-containing protein n=1 Tax=Aphanomyces invadans TaxID=157072 RepID=A0A024ULK0_9STRA|nr:hypothetical protein H310_01865 [Aphanomyces invadans]ETW07321.1 hypothetical protein H310_01865 [Aphanomyces invadans]|eukprot:XP_008863414.1 hypothetical protein H310_01865 [Aphanomyces invadans]